MQKIVAFVRREAVLCIAALAALISMLAAPPSAAYWDYIDFRVLALLWCLMAVVAGFRACGVFEMLTSSLLSASRGRGRVLGLALVLLPFFVSMAVTNDVALLAFVPFTMLLLEDAGCRRAIIPTLVLQTAAANLGSMATPVGNPQNLYLYGAYQLSPGEFFAVILPYAGISLVCLAGASLPLLPGRLSLQDPKTKKLPRGQLLLFGIDFLLCLLSVFRVLPWYVLLPVIALSLVFSDRKLLLAPDYALLATFVCFFIFSGNLGKIPAIRDFLQGLMARNTLLTSALASQVISNVPAAVLLSGFTEGWQGLLLGTDLGGLGTPVASLASLITMKLYAQSKDARLGKYVAVFMLVNLLGLALLLGIAAI